MSFFIRIYDFAAWLFRVPPPPKPRPLPDAVIDELRALNWLSPWEHLLDKPLSRLKYENSLEKEAEPMRPLFPYRKSYAVVAVGNSTILLWVSDDPPRYALAHVFWEDSWNSSKLLYVTEDRVGISGDYLHVNLDADSFLDSLQDFVDHRMRNDRCD